MSEAAQLDIADLLLIQQRLRHCSELSELGYFLTNDTQKVIVSRSVVLWLSRSGGQLVAASAVPEVAPNSPFQAWCKELCAHLSGQRFSQAVVIDIGALPETIEERWNEFFPSQVVWLPLGQEESPLGGLLYARENQWSSDELGLIDYWGGAVSHALDRLLHRSRLAEVKKLFVGWKFKALVGCALLLALFFPVSLSVLAPAELVPAQPQVVRAPIDGVLDKVHVKPNQTVKTGDLLFVLDDTSLKSRIDIASQELAIAHAEYRRANQASVTDRKIASQLPMLRARIEQRRAQLSYARSLLGRSEVRAVKEGIVVIPAAYELEGKPVKIGQKILTVTEPDDVELEMWIAVGDSIPLSDSAFIELFLNVQPGTSYAANIQFVNYQAEVSPTGIHAFRSRATLQNTKEALRVGWRGTAKIYGDEVPLYYYLFRRPYAMARQWLGI